MHKKLMMACMAIAAFAVFVLVSTASASPVLTENGSRVLAPVPDGVAAPKVIATNTGLFKFTGAIATECNATSMTWELTKNTGTEIEGKILAADVKFTGTGGGGDCTSSAFAPFRMAMTSNLCVKMSNKGSDTITTAGCGENLSFTVEFTGGEPCAYEMGSLSGTAITNTTPTLITISEQEAKLSSGRFFCPSSINLDMSFDLYTDNLPTETPLTIS